MIYIKSLPVGTSWKGKQSHACILFLDHVGVYSHTLNKVWFKITSKQIPTHAYSYTNKYIYIYIYIYTIAQTKPLEQKKYQWQ